MIRLTCTCVILVLCLPVSYEHGRMLEPPSRSSAWRVGFPTPRNEDDNQLYCGGFGIQQQNGGKCGICGDPWDEYPRANEAPGGIYATGIITKTYKQGSVIPIVLDITANHQGYFEFKLCPNNDIFFDPTQKCFDRYILKTGKKKGSKYPIYDYSTGIRMLYVHLPKNLNCEQCILQWTYKAGNNWGLCDDGTGAVGCGPQETFRACADIRILKDRSFSLSSQSASDAHKSTFNQQTHLQETEFDDYYDELFHESDENNIDYIDFQKSIRKYTKKDALNKMSSRKLRLLKRKLLLSMALKSLHNLIIQSKDTSQLNKPEQRKFQEQQNRKQDSNWFQNSNDNESTVSPEWEQDNQHSTVIPWWARTGVRHGKKRRRKKRATPFVLT